MKRPNLAHKVLILLLFLCAAGLLFRIPEGAYTVYPAKENNVPLCPVVAG